MPRTITVAVVTAACLSTAACTTTLTPPSPVADPVTVYVTDYGRHSSLLMPKGDGYTEYAFGEWGWFALGHTSMWRAPFILAIPGQSTLGRRDLGAIGNAEEATVRADGAAAQAMTVERQRVRDLITTLDSRFAAHTDTRIVGPDAMEFVKDPLPYHAFHNCNNVTADWMRELGITIHGPALYSNFQVEPPGPGQQNTQTPPNN
jgi:hypothetical protein